MTRTRSWAEVMAGVDRARFIPDVIWRHERGRAGNDLLPVDRHTDPDTWAAMVDSDSPIATQVNFGHPDEDGTGREVTSSSSDRRVVANMLEALDARAGEHVLEIGTGTGWTAAILAAAGVRVTSIEIDHDLVTRARSRRGDSVEVIAGDATMGWVLGAPYDRLIAGVGTASVPPAWVAQVRLGGRLVVPLTNSWQPPGVAVLERDEDGAVGGLAGRADFMALRDQATPRARGVDIPADPVQSSTEVNPYYLAEQRDSATAIGQRVSGITRVWRAGDDPSTGTLWLYADRSWASLSTTEGPPYLVE